MQRLDYLGSALFKEHLDREVTEMLSNANVNFNKVSDEVYLTDNQLLKFEDSEYLFFVDGTVHLFRDRLFHPDMLCELTRKLSEEFEQVLSDLDGEYVLLIVDKKRKKVIAICSETGSSAFFYQFVKDRLFFSNSFRLIGGLLESENDISFRRIFQIATGNNLGSEDTFLTNIRKLLPGQYVVFSSHGAETRTYSSVFENQKSRVPGSGDYLSEFRSIFERGVQKRMTSEKLGIALSGGRDSSAIAAMIARLKLEDQQVFTYTFKPRFDEERDRTGPPWDESPLVEDLIENYPVLKPHFLESETISVLESLENSLETYGEPVYGASNQFWIHTMHRQLQSDQIQILFTGQSGNFTLSWPPAELVHTKRRSIKQYLKAKTGYLSSEKTTLYFTDKFLKEVEHAADPINTMRGDITALQAEYLKNSINYVSSLQKQVSIKYGFRVTDPSTDKDLVEFCLKLPLKDYHDSQMSRKLVNLGLRGIVPGSILNNRGRGIQGSDLPFRLEQERHAIYEKLRFLNTNYLVNFVFDIERLVKEWNYLNFFQIKRRDLNKLLRVLLLSIFIERFERR